MPILIWYRQDELNEGIQFIGTCEYTQRTAFKIKVDAMCVAHGWHESQIKTIHSYLNSVQAVSYI